MHSAQNRAFLSRLTHDTAGTTVAIAAASIFALMGVVGGAVDISRSYMAQSRLQQACDAGALIARKSMEDETLTDAEKAAGYRYFDFNFPAGTYGVSLTSRTYSQPINSSGTPQAIVNGTVLASVPTTIMKIFGQESVPLTITCSSKMDITNADVAMVLDVTGSMNTDMRISASAAGNEPRITALRRAVKAFYDSLGPGRAAGDLSKGRIRYAFIPYGTVVNVGHLLTSTQLVDNGNYQSRLIESKTVYAWREGSETNPSYGNWSSMATIPAEAVAAAQVATNYGSFSTATSGSYTKLDGTAGTALALTVSGPTNTGTCAAKNDMIAGQTNLKAVGRGTAIESEAIAALPPVHPANTRTRTYTKTRSIPSIGFRYRWFKVGTQNACRLEVATGNASTQWPSQTQTKTPTQNILWTPYTGAQMTYGTRTINVSSLKTSGVNTSITITGLNRSGTPTDTSNVRLSGSNDLVTVTSGGTPTSVSMIWRGCVQERQIDPTITSSTSISSVPANAYDLNSTLLANAGNDATRWSPWLWQAAYAPPSGSRPINDDNDPDTDDEQCPAPALRLQEIGNYNTTILETPYPNLFAAASGNPTSYYYPYTTSRWGTSSTPAAERTKNSATLRNYIERIKLYDGTLHDAGFIWGLHLVSGEGMFASDNPDRFNGQLVSRHIVFMTDGEMNPGEERYVFSGYNMADGRLAPTTTTNSQMIAIENRRLRIMCEAAKSQGITVWVVAITSSSTDNYDDLRACASPGKFKSAATSNELVSSFTNIAQSIGGLRISQ